MNIKLLHLLFITSLAVCVYTSPAIAEPRLVGRFDTTTPETYRFGWPGSEIEYQFSGTSLSATISDSGKNSLMVVIDDKSSRLDLKPGKHDYKLATGLLAGEHNLSLIRITEGGLGPTTVSSVSTDGSFLPVPERPHRMLVIGDSISNGYGIEGQDQNCKFSAQTQNQWQTYAALTARELDADLVTLAVSGRGLVKNYAGNDLTMLALIDRIIPTEPRQIINDTYKPDVIVIHLGTNDFSGTTSPNTNRFTPTYLNLLNRLHTQFPAAKIYGAIGPMLQDHEYTPARSAIRSAIDQYNDGLKESAAQTANFIEFRGTTYNHFGCDWHPNIAAHQAMAKSLVQRIQADLNSK